MIFNSIETAERWTQEYGHLQGVELVQSCMSDLALDRICLVSSFGIEAAVLLSMVSDIHPAFPVAFIDTHKLFPETLAYRDELISVLKLTNVKTIHPDYVDLESSDPDGVLWEENSNSCCTIRKVLPLRRALKSYDVWISGRKRYHGGSRSYIPKIENFEGRVKINPLADFTAEEIQGYFTSRSLPVHLLREKGYLSVGCVPCTSLPADENDVRSGRWKGQGKQECGIHLGTDGKFRQQS